MPLASSQALHQIRAVVQKLSRGGSDPVT